VTKERGKKGRKEIQEIEIERERERKKERKREREIGTLSRASASAIMPTSRAFVWFRSSFFLHDASNRSVNCEPRYIYLGHVTYE